MCLLTINAKYLALKWKSRLYNISRNYYLQNYMKNSVLKISKLNTSIFKILIIKSLALKFNNFLLFNFYSSNYFISLLSINFPTPAPSPTFLHSIPPSPCLWDSALPLPLLTSIPLSWGISLTGLVTSSSI